MKLLLTGAFNYNKEQLNTLQSLGYEILFIQDERLPLQVDVSDIDAVVCNSLFLYNDIKKFKSLKYIQLTSAGVDRVPLDYIKEQRIKLYNAKDVYSIPMAEWVVLKVLEIYKKSLQFYKSQSEHNWEKRRNLFELTDKNVAIIGFGSVGREVAKRLKAFGVNIFGVSRSVINSGIVNEYYNIAKIEEVLSKSDIVVFTIPHTSETNHLVDANKIAKMKDNCVLVNVSRGGIIDEDALITALLNDKFLGVALDVFEEEPLSKNNPLWDIERVIVTPHNSFVSDKVEERLFKLTLKNLRSSKV
ncbi:NAD(P)-dependent oxidoreductase [Rossellomorea aquimaris]|nr:NAD(P)-dependent oxidoreductase [Rossellomorea aquimaris]WRP06322.1 NAD(P)-dependent oxidoreductase [Rossellomorea aquimaris]